VFSPVVVDQSMPPAGSLSPAERDFRWQEAARVPAGSDVAADIAEMRRIARRRLVFFTWYPRIFPSFWLL
jgi:hypothetical protein